MWCCDSRAFALRRLDLSFGWSADGVGEGVREMVGIFVAIAMMFLVGLAMEFSK